LGPALFAARNSQKGGRVPLADAQSSHNPFVLVNYSWTIWLNPSLLIGFDGGLRPAPVG
jgi:hypothetical protein